MYVRTNAKVLDVITKDWKMGERSGTSTKVQLLIEQTDKSSVLTAKYNPDEFEIQHGENIDVTLEFKETPNGITCTVVQID